ncbi:DUF4013 domain-containing protein [Halopenitus sp. POP-27]|uniref:DUF4013 domain-containing protein n=1 Tax=Halopenitus sp. POP-27 TaxID=2994425 RepID=UPI0024692804|nr:DUF4013 domain-containing protein [Halopenitus sp. POP-27]
MLREAIATPGRGPDVVATVLAGTALLVLGRIAALAWFVGVAVDPRVVALLPIAGAPLFILRGYDVAVVRAGIEGDPGAPAFRNLSSLYVDGVKSVVLSIGYALPVVLVPVIGVAAMTVQSARESGVPVGEALVWSRFAGSGVFGSGVDVAPIGIVSGLMEGMRSLAVAIVTLVPDPGSASAITIAIGVVTIATTCSAAAGAIYVQPAGLACFAATGRLRDGLRPRRVLRVAGSGEYVVGWLLEAVVGIVGTAAALALSPFLVGIAGLFVVRVVTRSLYGRGSAPVLRPDAGGGSGGTSGSGGTGGGDGGVDNGDGGDDHDGGSDDGGSDADRNDDDGPPADDRVAIESDDRAELPVGRETDPAIQVGRRVGPVDASESADESSGESADESSGESADGSSGESADESADGFVWGAGGTAGREDKR